MYMYHLIHDMYVYQHIFFNNFTFGIFYGNLIYLEGSFFYFFILFECVHYVNINLICVLVLSMAVAVYHVELLACVVLALLPTRLASSYLFSQCC